ncbi:hypothetical protein HFO84_00010 [Rhizobium leguminosarum]|uniref:hypothetical protein n=1 Tax=Rhizobium leguminosarum TaxID=384 RepID=UPI001C943B9A|nr:hypothetical protein [Rhizobium leguminosarum]MBY5475714.1 hypothetical protein [Rhizobium leguminosarum]
MDIHDFNTARKVYLTDDEDILSSCAVGVYRPTLRVHMPFGQSYATLSDIERAVLWAFERYLKSGELDDRPGAWIFRGLGQEFSFADIVNRDIAGFRVIVAGDGYDDYEDLVDSRSMVDLDWAKFVHMPSVAQAA